MTDPLHNILGQSKEAFLDHVAQISAEQKEVDEAAAVLAGKRKRLKKARKLAQADGVVLGDLDLVLKYHDQGADELREAIQRQSAYAAAMGVAEIGQQLDMFADAGKATVDMIQKAEGLGLLCGVRGGEETENPYAPNSEQGNAWLGQFREGRARFDKAHGRDLPEPPKGKPGRPKKAEGAVGPEGAEIGPDAPQDPPSNVTVLDRGSTDEVEPFDADKVEAL